MKKTTRTVIAITAILITCASCRTALETNPTNVETKTDTIQDREMVIYQDNHTASRKEADKIFNDWTQRKGISKHVTSKRLRSITPRTDGCHLMYDFKLLDGSQRRIDIIVKNFHTEYKKNHKAKGTVIVNSKKYELYD